MWGFIMYVIVCHHIQYILLYNLSICNFSKVYNSVCNIKDILLKLSGQFLGIEKRIEIKDLRIVSVLRLFSCIWAEKGQRISTFILVIVYYFTHWWKSKKMECLYYLWGVFLWIRGSNIKKKSATADFRFYLKS